MNTVRHFIFVCERLVYSLAPGLLSTGSDISHAFASVITGAFVSAE